MSFTDEDLECLKEWLNNRNKKSTELVFSTDWNALIFRLEAAEKVCVGIEHICDQHNLHGQAEVDLKAWRKSAGKDAPK